MQFSGINLGLFLLKHTFEAWGIRAWHWFCHSTDHLRGIFGIPHVLTENLGQRMKLVPDVTLR